MSLPKKVFCLTLSSCLVFFGHAHATLARYNSDLNDPNFSKFFLENSTSTRAWQCAVYYAGSSSAVDCPTDSSLYHAQATYGIVIGATDTAIEFWQQADGVGDAVDLTLEFDYKVKHPSTVTDSDKLLVQIEKQYVWEPETVWEQSLTTTTDWQTIRLNVQEYASGEPVIQFVVDNDATDLSTVALRNVRLLPTSDATIFPFLYDKQGDSIQPTNGKMKVQTKRGGRTITSIPTYGFIESYVPPARQPRHFSFIYKNKTYWFDLRLRRSRLYLVRYKMIPGQRRLKRLNDYSFYSLVK